MAHPAAPVHRWQPLKLSENMRTETGRVLLISFFDESAVLNFKAALAAGRWMALAVVTQSIGDEN